MNYYMKNRKAEISLIGGFVNYDDAKKSIEGQSFIWIKAQVAIDEMYNESKDFATKENL